MKLDKTAVGACAIRAALAALLAALAAAAQCAEDKPASGAAAATTATSNKCASVVIRHCRAQFVPDRTPERPDTIKAKDVPGHWEAVRTTELDSGEILIEEERLRNPAVREVFDRNLRSEPAGYVTRPGTGGARCTTITSTGATFCSHPGLETPSSGLPHAEFSDGVF
jgi:hypothetical protein